VSLCVKCVSYHEDYAENLWDNNTLLCEWALIIAEDKGPNKYSP